MTCTTVRGKDGTLMILCSRGRHPRLKECATCGLPGALLCDGCDQVVCGECSVSPATEQDFCPRCFSPVFKKWLTEYAVDPSSTTKQQRRRAFRAWAMAMPNAFDVINRTPEGLAARALGCNHDAGTRRAKR